jgi:hypothetical protein
MQVIYYSALGSAVYWSYTWFDSTEALAWWAVKLMLPPLCLQALVYLLKVIVGKYLSKLLRKFEP